MNTFNPLALLKKILADAAHSQPVELHRSNAMDKVLEQLTADAKAGAQTDIPKDVQIEAVRRFWHTKRLTSFRDARLVSFGLGLDAWEDGRCLLEDEALLRTALKEIEKWSDNPRKLRRCYQGLMHSYFEYDGMAQSLDAPGHKNWLLLRTCLQQKIDFLQDDQSFTPEWVDYALENSNLFTDNPAQAYGQELLQNNSERVDNIRQLIGITDTSWFTRALVLGQIEAATKQSNSDFQNLVTKLLQLIENNEFLRNHGLRLILEHYAEIPNAPQHIGLKECAAHWWGNPWLPSNKTQWGFNSLKKAREMVSNWLKEEFIDLFFRKLSQNKFGDTRRAKFWQQYVPSIRDIQFALGRNARQSEEKDFVEIREKIKGFIVNLDDTARSNNAFIMRIGDFIAVEFSDKSNAFYGYSLKNPLPFDLTKPVRSGPVDGHNSLKNNKRILHFIHQDNIHSFSSWEDRFENDLRNKFIYPGGKIVINAIGNDYNLANENKAPSREKAQSNKSNFPVQKTYDLFDTKKIPVPRKNDSFSISNLRILSQQIDGTIKDNTDKGGALWISAKNFTAEANKTLKQWGFTYSDGKGWWRK